MNASFCPAKCLCTLQNRKMLNEMLQRIKGEIIFRNQKEKDEYIAEEFDKSAKGYDKSLIVKSYQR